MLLLGISKHPFAFLPTPSGKFCDLELLAITERSARSIAQATKKVRSDGSAIEKSPNPVVVVLVRQSCPERQTT